MIRTIRLFHTPLLAFPLLLAACSGGDFSGASKLQSAGDTIRVTVVPVRSERVDVRRTYTGIVSAFEEVSISSGSPGRIARLRVDVGARVRRGQLLVDMDSTTLLTSRAQLVTLERDFRRIDTLYRVGSMSAQQWAQAKTQLEVARAQLANLAVNTRLTSPIDGVVTGRYYHAGELYSMTPSAASGGRAAILIVMQTDPVKISVPVPEGDIANVQDGQKVDVQLDAYPHEHFTGSVYRVAPTLDAVTHTTAVEVTVPNAKGTIRPGMYARTTFTYGQRECVLVPDLAVQRQRGTNEKYVFVAQDGVVRRTVVELGDQIGDSYATLSGLKGSEQVVVSGFQNLRDSALVKVVE